MLTAAVQRPSDNDKRQSDESGNEHSGADGDGARLGWSHGRIRNLLQRREALAGITVATGHRGSEPISLPNNRLDETWLVGIVVQRETNLADGRIYAVIDIQKDVFSP